MKRFQWMITVCIVLLVSLAPLAGASQKSIDGKWSGVASAGPDGDIYFSISFKTVESKLTGTINIPDLGMYDTVLTGVSFNGTDVSAK